MVHVEITQDGKSIFSENYDENDIRIERRRAISALFKTGEMKASEIAPSRYCQDIIVGESVADGVIGTRTNVKDDAIMISHIPTWAHHCTVNKEKMNTGHEDSTSYYGDISCRKYDLPEEECGDWQGRP